ncbi:MAG: hypothetical protein COA32_14980 [Fluviicola sp.]|nr:MAG: hypothetical protein COA32_14980 [Fluviicola sp.]
MKEKELLIEFYHVKNHSFIKEIDITKYSLQRINEICPPNDEGDFEYCNSRYVREYEFDILKNYITELSDYNYRDFIYNIITRATWG